MFCFLIIFEAEREVKRERESDRMERETDRTERWMKWADEDDDLERSMKNNEWRKIKKINRYADRRRERGEKAIERERGETRRQSRKCSVYVEPNFRVQGRELKKKIVIKNRFFWHYSLQCCVLCCPPHGVADKPAKIWNIVYLTMKWNILCSGINKDLA